ncbi:MAG TPA: glycosyltransferase family 2 protein [Gemmatimonadaceae bacterium]|nr:glycosyltransferase family 2 protein [Gemmatimonadaceae bacterium]
MNDVAPASDPLSRPSVVIASAGGLPRLWRAVDALRPELERTDAQLVIARSAPAAEEPVVRQRLPQATVVWAPPGAGIPRLRGLGLAASTGDPVAITEDHLVAGPQWLERLFAPLRLGVDIVGGGMQNRVGSGAVAWGAYLSDYGFYSYARPASDAAIPLLTMANLAYRRRDVARIAEWCSDGAWENVVHDRLAAEGRTLAFAPDARIVHDHDYRFADFLRNRYEHGWDYARARLTENPRAPRFPLIAMTPVLPLVLLVRIARAAAGEDRGAFLRALPITVAFLYAWSAGEAMGYVRGPIRPGEELGRVVDE